MEYMTYENLNVFKQSYALMLELHKLTQPFPKNEQYGGIADQVRRSSRSICANIAEGLGRKSSEADERRFLAMALGSAEETRVWLMMSGDLGYIAKAETDRLRKAYSEIAMMLFGLMKQRTTVS